MKLRKLIQNLDGIKDIKGKLSIEIKGIACDSKAIREAFLFAAIKGSCFNGADFISEALERGARAVVVEADPDNLYAVRRDASFIYVSDARRAISEICRNFYGNISTKMSLIGITGTNGKTTTSYLIENLFRVKGEKAAVIGTINYRFGGRVIPAGNTTPGVVGLYGLLSDIERQDIKNCILEVSSHSLEQGRVDTLFFDAAIFTNLTGDHLDYHGSMENYIASKARLFEKIKRGGFGIVNIDDVYSKRIIETVRTKKDVRLITYGIEQGSDVYARDIDFSSEGLAFELCIKGDCIDVTSSLIGRYNVYNILGSAACGVALGMSLKQIALAIEELVRVPGRLEKIDCARDFSVFVDYAHTEDALANVLVALRRLKPKRLFSVFGCGGDRDSSKRPGMGRIASELSDRVFITSDNPRNEDPMAIISDITKGIRHRRNNYVVERDRLKAIDMALKEAGSGDIVLVAGKGHETYQIFKDTILPFDDREVVRRILSEDTTYKNL